MYRCFANVVANVQAGEKNVGWVTCYPRENQNVGCVTCYARENSWVTSYPPYVFSVRNVLPGQIGKFLDDRGDLFRGVCGADAAAQETGAAGCCRWQHHVDVNTRFQQLIPIG